MDTSLFAKTVTCKCGNSYETTKAKTWCQKCCRPVFYHDKDRRKHMINSYYMITVILMVLMFITYLFIEMIADPLLSM